MKGIEIRNIGTYRWARIGSADIQFTFIILSLSIILIIGLTYIMFQSLPENEWRIITLFIILCILIGCIGSFFLPIWWLPLLLTLAVIGLVDMTTDLYWYMKILNISDKAKYWDKGRELHVVWKE